MLVDGIKSGVRNRFLNSDFCSLYFGHNDSLVSIISVFINHN